MLPLQLGLEALEGIRDIRFNGAFVRSALPREFDFMGRKFGENLRL